jgi:hypothetical protein
MNIARPIDLESRKKGGGLAKWSVRESGHRGRIR